MAVGRGELILNSVGGIERRERGEHCPRGGGRALEAEPRADPPLALEPEARVSTLSNEN